MIDGERLLPRDWRAGLFVGRMDRGAGPSPVLVRGGVLLDMSGVSPTVSQLLEDRAAWHTDGEPLGEFDAWLADTGGRPLLAPVDLQCIKAAGVTFAVSATERVIEERARGDANAAAAIRQTLEARIGGGLKVTPGSREAAALKEALIAEGLWSQYLEVAIGPDAEIFTKAPLLSAVGWGAEVGVRSDSYWNNPEPEVVLIADSAGAAVGATLGNDVNLRDFEGRSALLLGKAKDNNAACAIGPMIRLFDVEFGGDFGMDDVRGAAVELVIEGDDGYRLQGISRMAEISRDPEELLRQTFSEHQYPDGVALFLGTLFAPTEDRDVPGAGFTHRVGDQVRIASPRLGTLENRVTTSAAAAPWRFGVGALMRNLASRGMLGSDA